MTYIKGVLHLDDWTERSFTAEEWSITLDDNITDEKADELFDIINNIISLA